MEVGVPALIAALGGGALVLGMLAHLLFSTFGGEVRLRSQDSHVLEVQVRGHITQINLANLDTEDPAKLDKAIEAVQAAKKAECA